MRALRLWALGLMFCSCAMSPPPDDNESGNKAPAEVVSEENIITITDKGTASAFDDVLPITGASKANVAIANGASIIVEVSMPADIGSVSSVVWNSQALSLDDSRNTGTIATFIYSKHNVTGATGSVVVVVASPDPGLGLVFGVAQVTGLATSSTLDQSSGTSGSGTSPSIAIGAPTSQANEIVIGAIGSDAGAGVGGTWQNSFTALNDVTDAGMTVSQSFGYRIVSAVGTYTAAKTGANSAGWCAIIATYKQTP